MALIPPLHSYTIWTLAGMGLAHSSDPTIAFVSNMAALARPRQGVIHHAHMLSHSGFGPETKAKDPKATGPQALAQKLLGPWSPVPGPYPSRQAIGNIFVSIHLHMASLRIKMLRLSTNKTEIAEFAKSELCFECHQRSDSNPIPKSARNVFDQRTKVCASVFQTCICIYILYIYIYIHI